MSFFKYIRNIVFFTMVAWAGCDIVEEPYMLNPNNNNPIDTTDTSSVDTTVKPVRRVLLEDYTGHRCGNCPRSHEKIQELLAIYGDKIVPICMHVGFFAMPIPPYTVDYRTPAGDELNSYFGNDNAGLPNGMVNRSELDGSVILTHTSWEQVIQSELAKDPEIEIKITNSCDTSSHKLQTSIKVTSLTDLSQTLKLVVFLKEDSLVSMQTDYDHTPVDISDYVHRYVMRGAINSTWGDVIAIDGMVKEQVAQRDYIYTLNANWVEKHCCVVVYVYQDDTKQVIQAEEKMILPED